MTATGVLVVLACASAGAALARLLQLPMWPITGAIVGAALGNAAVGGLGDLPDAVPLAGQAIVGIAVGSAISPAVLRVFRSTATPGAIAVLAIVGVGLGAGAGIAASGLLAPTEAVLGMVPGGVGEMVAAATALDADGAVVGAMHVARLLVVVSVLPLLVRWVARWSPPPEEEADQR